MHAGSFSSIAPSHAGNGGQFTHNGSFTSRSNFGSRSFASPNNFANRTNNFAGRNGNWAGHHDWDHYFGGRGWGWGGWGGWGGYWPWYGGWGLGLDWGYPYDYGYYYPNAGDYYNSYPQPNYYAPTGYADYYAPSYYGDTGVVAEPAMAAPHQPPTPAVIARSISEEDPLRTDLAEGRHGASDALQYYSEARTAFLQGDYRSALRLAGHAGVDEPRNPKVHELISLALFALRNYTAAASEAHAAMALGTTADWKDLVGYYFDAEKHTAQLGALEAETYTTQLRALETASSDNPKSAAEHFLLGYHYLMIGARENAKTQFAEALKLTPNDKLAGQYRPEFQSNRPLAPPQVVPSPRGTEL